MPTLRPLALAVALASWGWPLAASAHGVTSEVERRGEAWAVRVRSHGEPLAGATFQVLRPGEADPVRTGITPADGWVELVPDVPGTWTVKVVDRSGHGKTVAVEVGEERARGASPGPTATTTPTATPTATTTTTATPTATSTTTTSTSTTTTTGAEGDGPRPLAVILAAAGIVLLSVALRAIRRRAGARR